MIKLLFLLTELLTQLLLLVLVSKYLQLVANILWNAGTDNWDFNRSINLPSGLDFKIDGVGTNERIDDRLNNLIQVGEGLDIVYDDTANTLTFSAELATSSNPGVASFSSDYFTVDGAGEVIIHEVNGGTY